MIIQKLPNANAHVISVTDTSTSLYDLIGTAAATTLTLGNNLNAIDILPEDGDIRVLFSEEDPTSTKGLLLNKGVMYSFKKRHLRDMKLIRVGSSNVSCSIVVGYTEGTEDPGDTFSVVESSGGSESGEAAGTELTVTGGVAADPTSLPSAVDAGDAVQSTHSLEGEILSYLSRYISGEDSGRDVMKVQNQNDYEYISTNTTTTVKSGAGHLKAITIGTKGASSNTLTVYDNTAGSGDIIAVIDTTSASAEATFHFDCEFTNGLTIVTATGTAPKATIIYS